MATFNTICIIRHVARQVLKPTFSAQLSLSLFIITKFWWFYFAWQGLENMRSPRAGGSVSSMRGPRRGLFLKKCIQDTSLSHITHGRCWTDRVSIVLMPRGLTARTMPVATTRESLEAQLLTTRLWERCQKTSQLKQRMDPNVSVLSLLT